MHKITRAVNMFQHLSISIVDIDHCGR